MLLTGGVYAFAASEFSNESLGDAVLIDAESVMFSELAGETDLENEDAVLVEENGLVFFEGKETAKAVSGGEGSATIQIETKFFGRLTATFNLEE